MASKRRRSRKEQEDILRSWHVHTNECAEVAKASRTALAALSIRAWEAQSPGDYGESAR